MSSQADALYYGRLINEADMLEANGSWVTTNELMWAQTAKKLAEILMAQTGYSHRTDRPGRKLPDVIPE